MRRSASYPAAMSAKLCFVATALETLETRLGANWSALLAARARTEDVVGQLSAALGGLHAATCSVVVTGSYGCADATGGSAAAWVLFVDGPADPEDASLARKIEARVREIVPKDVGPTG